MLLQKDQLIVLNTLSLSVVIPVYNARDTLLEVWNRLNTTLEQLGLSFEVIFVEDGSRDDSWCVLDQLAESDMRVKAIRLMRNQGQHNALLCGIRVAKYPLIVTMDDDLQHAPEDIPKLISPLTQNYDVVYGAFQEQCHGFFRNFASKFSKIIIQYVMGVATGCNISAFRAFRTDLRQAFSGYCGSMPNVDVMLSWGTTRFCSIPVLHQHRRTGMSNYTLRKLVVHAINMITGFSTIPLQVAGILGLFFTLVGFGLLAFVISRYVISGSPVPGFPFLASIVSLLSGVQLFVLGIMGEYFARMYQRLMGKPVYTVAETRNIQTQGMTAK